MTYDLRRLRLHGLIERIPHTHRYHVTDFGFRAALTITRTYNRLLRPSLAVANALDPPMPTMLRNAIDRVDSAIQRAHLRQDIAA